MQLKVVFYSNKLYIGLVGKDLFELDELKNNNVSTIFEKFYDEVEMILSIVKEIQSNHKVFKL